MHTLRRYGDGPACYINVQTHLDSSKQSVMLSFLRFTPVGQRIPNGAVVILTSELQFKTSTKRALDSDRLDLSSDRSEHSSSNSRRPSHPTHSERSDSTVENTSTTTVVQEENAEKNRKPDRRRISRRLRPLSRPTFVFSFLLIVIFSSIVPFVRSVNVSSETESEGGYGETTANIAREYSFISR